MKQRLYKIGELAELSGVPTKTIRFYSDIGALPPTRVSASGYRLYSDTDRGRLALIRALRDIDIPLPSIIDLLHSRGSVTTALSLQLAAVEVELRTVRRQHALLKAALDKGEAAALAYLDQARTIAKLGALERQQFLSDHLERAFDGVPVDEAWKARFWQGAALDLPEELIEAQFAAWLELAELVSDEDFIRRLNEMGREAWGAARAQDGAADWGGDTQRIYFEADEARRAGHTPHDARGQQLVDAYVRQQARVAGRLDDPGFPADLLATIERNTDPRAARYWELIAVLKGWPAESPIATGHNWLVEGLRWRVAHA
jgi:DNA-binding transcriptional MerR regulator